MHRHDLFPNNELICHYRQVFSSGPGLEVLTHILYDLGIFTDVSSGPEDVALKNYGNRLLRILSGGEADAESIQNFAKRLMRQPLPKEKENSP